MAASFGNMAATFQNQQAMIIPPFASRHYLAPSMAQPASMTDSAIPAHFGSMTGATVFPLTLSNNSSSVLPTLTAVHQDPSDGIASEEEIVLAKGTVHEVAKAEQEISDATSTANFTRHSVLSSLESMSARYDVQATANAFRQAFVSTASTESQQQTMSTNLYMVMPSLSSSSSAAVTFTGIEQHQRVEHINELLYNAASSSSQRPQQPYFYPGLAAAAAQQLAAATSAWQQQQQSSSASLKHDEDTGRSSERQQFGRSAAPFKLYNPHFMNESTIYSCDSGAAAATNYGSLQTSSGRQQQQPHRSHQLHDSHVFFSTTNIVGQQQQHGTEDNVKQTHTNNVVCTEPANHAIAGAQVASFPLLAEYKTERVATANTTNVSALQSYIGHSNLLRNTANHSQYSYQQGFSQESATNRYLYDRQYAAPHYHQQVTFPSSTAVATANHSQSPDAYSSTTAMAAAAAGIAAAAAAAAAVAATSNNNGNDNINDAYSNAHVLLSTYGGTNRDDPFLMAAAQSMGASAADICDARELEAFAERFKQRRIKLGVTQADVGKALANLKLPGVGSLSQSTICRFESLTLSHNNMLALQPVLNAWLEQAEREAMQRALLTPTDSNNDANGGLGVQQSNTVAQVNTVATSSSSHHHQRAHSSNSSSHYHHSHHRNEYDGKYSAAGTSSSSRNVNNHESTLSVLLNVEKKRKRTSIPAAEKRSLEAYFTLQARPSSEKIATIAERLDLRKNVVRVWFCNQRQKQKRMKFAAAAAAGSTS